MDVLADLDARGLIHDTTDREALAARLAAGPVTLYYGCDPTADSLHIGNLIGLLVLRRFADAGHRPIALAGGATGMVGDPGGRSSERNLLDEATLRANAAAIKEQITRVLGDPDAYELVDNLDWTRDLTLLEFLREVGKHVTVNQMMARESVKARLASEHGISFTEFSYMLLQGNDYRI
ncbi:MAG: tyrosine--tRNA ligase, partial [Actinomycetota bacterium]|nr:tyrosine--tRNA ligase [Actinomycetota bacterium]